MTSRSHDTTGTQELGRQLHQHRQVVAHALRQHAGIPYEVEQKVCPDCRAVLDERTVRRAAA
jgi:NMD protein affecting ribosome stability and mRNA decay